MFTAERHTAADPPTDLPLRVWVVLARAYAAVEARAAADAARHGFTLAEFGVLETLYHKGPLRLGEVQRRLLVSSGGVTYLVDRLVRRGLVERRAVPDDRRTREAALTAKGRRLMSRIFPQHASCIADALAGLSPAEQNRLRGLLRKAGRYAVATHDESQHRGNEA